MTIEKSKTELNSIFMPELNSQNPILWIFNFGAEEKLRAKSHPQIFKKYEELAAKATVLVRENDAIITGFSNDENKTLTKNLGKNFTNRKNLTLANYKTIVPWVYTREVKKISQDNQIPLICDPNLEIYNKLSMIKEIGEKNSDFITSSKQISVKNSDNNILLAKALYSCSGRRQILLSKPISNHENVFIESIIKKDGGVILEPYDRVTKNYSALFSTTSQSVFFTTFKNKNNFCYTETEEIFRDEEFKVKDKDGILENIESCRKYLKRQNYKGPASMDFYEHIKNGHKEIRKFTELNPRFSFGHVALYQNI